MHMRHVLNVLYPGTLWPQGSQDQRNKHGVQGVPWYF